MYEVIVTDDGDGESAKVLIQSDYPDVRWMPGPKRGPAANRNSAARQVFGQWLVFIDDDCIASPGWLQSLSERIACDDALGVLEGRTIAPDKSDDPLTYVVENDGGNFWSCNLAVRTDVFRLLEGFDEDFTLAFEDVEFACRLKKMGVKSLFVPNAVVEHPVRRLGIDSLSWRLRREYFYMLYRFKTEVGCVEKESLLQSMERVARLTFDDVASSLKTVRTRARRGQPFSVYIRCGLRVVSLPVALVYHGFLNLLIRRRYAKKTK